MRQSRVNCVVPVRNRCEITLRFIELFFLQDYPEIKLYVINDGSTDETQEKIEKLANKNIVVLNGDGNLWWGGSIQRGMLQLLEDGANDSDFVLMMNDDVQFGPEFVSELVNLSMHKKIVAAIELDENGVRIGGGFKIDYYKTQIKPLIPNNDDVNVDSLPGRGVLFPVGIVRKHGVINPKMFQHYMADVSYFAMLKNAGCDLIVTPSVSYVTSGPTSDKLAQDKSFISRRFAFKSKNNLLHKLKFFRFHGPLNLRSTSYLRYFYFRVIGKLI